MDNKKVTWEPDDSFTITGEELEKLLKLGDLYVIPKSALTADLEAKVYLKFLEAKTSILDRFIETGQLKVLEN